MLGHPGVGWGEELEMSPLNGAQSRPGQPPPKNSFPLIAGTPSPPHLPDPSSPSPPRMQGAR